MIKLGIIGISDGNGHPYSWSAIINGYDEIEMSSCPYDSIFRYLIKDSYPGNRFLSAQVTHIWTQDSNISISISKACLIPIIVQKPIDMLGEIDALLLARDDYQKHSFFAAPFLKAGIPVYIDKPIATSNTEFDNLLEMEIHTGQIFSCSALRFSHHLESGFNIYENKIGKLVRIEGKYIKEWDKYAVHVIDPIVHCLTGEDLEIKDAIKSNNGVLFNMLSGLEIFIHKNKDKDIDILLIGEKGMKRIVLNDTFYSFSKALTRFIRIVNLESPAMNISVTRKIVEMIEFGMGI
jgi:predicted dehydrogenase